MKSIINFLLILFLCTGCDNRIEKTNEIPEDFQGVWLDKDFEEWKKVITENLIYHYELQESVDTPAIIDTVSEIYLIKRRKCEDCIPYGLEIRYKDEKFQRVYLYLDNLHPGTEKFMKLSLSSSYFDENDGDWIPVSSSKWIREMNKEPIEKK